MGSFRSLYGWVIHQYAVAAGRCVSRQPSRQPSPVPPPVGVNRASVAELFQALQDDCAENRAHYACSYVSLRYRPGSCASHLPAWCVEPGTDPAAAKKAQAYQVAMADLLGTLPRTCPD